jgi:hypothetical protein
MQRMGYRERGYRIGLAAACAGLALAAAPTTAVAQEAPETQQVHIVRPGDTLWDLARQYLRDPFRWREIHELNRATIANPHWIYPAERIRLPFRGVAGDTVPVAPVLAREWAARDRTVFFQPDGAALAADHQLRLAAAAPAALVTRGDYLRAGVLVPETQVVPAGVLVELLSPSVVPLTLPPQIQQFDRVYMTVSRPDDVMVGDRLLLLRPGRRVGQHGRLYESTGVVRVEEVHGDVATIVVEEMYGAVAVGDAAVPLPDFTGLIGVRPRSAAGLEGRIVAFQAPHALQSVEDIAFLDLGRDAGVGEGDEFVVLLPAERRSWGVRPEIEVARLRVVRTTERTSAARVIGLQQPALEPGLPVRLVARLQ